MFSIQVSIRTVLVKGGLLRPSLEQGVALIAVKPLL